MLGLLLSSACVSFAPSTCMGVGIVTDAGLAACAQSLSQSLCSLDLSYCELLSDDGLMHLASMPKLESVHLIGCTRLTRGSVFFAHGRVISELEADGLQKLLIGAAWVCPLPCSKGKLPSELASENSFKSVIA